MLAVSDSSDLDKRQSASNAVARAPSLTKSVRPKFTKTLSDSLRNRAAAVAADVVNSSKEMVTEIQDFLGECHARTILYCTPYKTMALKIPWRSRLGRRGVQR